MLHWSSLKLDRINSMSQWECTKNTTSSENLQRGMTTTQIFKSKLVTVVGKFQKTSKELPTSAQPPRAQDQNVILPTHNKKSRQQPPPASRHRSLLTLDHVVPLFDMRANMSKNIYDIMRSSKEALPIQKWTTITTHWVSKIEEDSTYVELLVSFYSPAPDDGTNNFKKKGFQGDNTRKLDTQDVFWGTLPVHNDEFPPHSRIYQYFWKKVHNNEWIKLVVPFAEGHHPHAVGHFCVLPSS